MTIEVIEQWATRWPADVVPHLTLLVHMLAEGPGDDPDFLSRMELLVARAKERTADETPANPEAATTVSSEGTEWIVPVVSDRPQEAFQVPVAPPSQMDAALQALTFVRCRVEHSQDAVEACDGIQAELARDEPRRGDVFEYLDVVSSAASADRVALKQIKNLKELAGPLLA